MLDKAGWFNRRSGLFLYSFLYFEYKKYLEGRQLIKHLGYLKRSNTCFSSVPLVIDVGAHIGFFTRESLRFFPNAKVIAVEPPGRNSSFFQLLNKERITKGIVRLQNKAAWSFDGQIPFHFESTNTANNRFDSHSTTWVPCLTIDSLISQGASLVLILKIDVQGYEFEVLEGAIETLKNNKVALLIEMDESALQARGRSSTELFQKLKDLGFYPKNSQNGEELELHQVLSMLSKKDCLDFLFLSIENYGEDKNDIDV
jgi:FkbM family methyltransferase